LFANFEFIFEFVLLYQPIQSLYTTADWNWVGRTDQRVINVTAKRSWVKHVGLDFCQTGESLQSWDCCTHSF